MMWGVNAPGRGDFLLKNDNFKIWFIIRAAFIN